MEGLNIFDIVDQDYGIGIAVVALDNASKPFLTSCVPKLQFYEIAVDVDRSGWGEGYLNRKSTPMVESMLSSKLSSAYLRMSAVLPTAACPRKQILNM